MTRDAAELYVTDRGMVDRLVVPARPNNWACAAAQRHHHRRLLAAGVAILEYPAMVHAKAFVRYGHDVLIETCNLDAWSLWRSYEIDVRLESRALAAKFASELFAPAVARPGHVATMLAARAGHPLLAFLSPLL